jgi:hypothetical protein
MKNVTHTIKRLVVGTALALSLASTLHAQTSTVGSLGAASMTASNLAAIVAAVAQTTPIPAQSIPQFGTFYSAQNPNWPPSPGNFNNLAAWSLGDGAYLIRFPELFTTEAGESAEARCPRL